MNFFARRIPQAVPLVVLTTLASGQVRSTRYEKRRCTHLGFHEATPSHYEVHTLREAPRDEHRRGYLTAEEASWDNYGRHPDDRLGVVHQLRGEPA